jgi:hypothetical protein
MPAMPVLSPVVVVFLGLGTAYALLFHLWWGARLSHLLYFWLVSVLGFGLGLLVAGLWQYHPLMLAGIPVAEGSAGALALLLFARRFAV